MHIEHDNFYFVRFQKINWKKKSWNYYFYLNRWNRWKWHIIGKNVYGRSVFTTICARLWREHTYHLYMFGFVQFFSSSFLCCFWNDNTPTDCYSRYFRGVHLPNEYEYLKCVECDKKENVCVCVCENDMLKNRL